MHQEAAPSQSMQDAQEAGRDEADSLRWHQTLREQETDLGRHAMEPSPDPKQCALQCDLLASMAELASNICLLAERHPDNTPMQDRCQDGKTRHARARERVGVTCECQGHEARP